MTEKEVVIEQIHKAFGGNAYPGDAYIQGTFEGCEPYEEVGAFKGREDWKTLDAGMLDGHYDALCFFSEAGFRFFLPAYLVADLRDELQTADPVFHLTGGFSTISVKSSDQSESSVLKTGGSVLLNPRRYGAMTFCDYARFRLSIFTREEAQAIVAYLNYRRDTDVHGIDKDRIDAALNSFWLDRAENAPSAESLRRHVGEEEESVARIRAKSPEKV